MRSFQVDFERRHPQALQTNTQLFCYWSADSTHNSQEDKTGEAAIGCYKLKTK